jgi:hypothetical protein
MMKRILALVLAWQLLVPARALPEFLLAIATKPPPQGKAAKICPCTQKVGCDCCGCTDEDEPVKEEAADGEPKSSRPALSQKCQCKAAEPLAASGEYLPSVNLTTVPLAQPLPEYLAASFMPRQFIFLPVDTPPPRSIPHR